MKNWIRLLLLTGALILITGAVWAENAEFGDYREDFSGYARAVAALTSTEQPVLRAASSDGEGDAEYALCRLLVMTDGATPDFAAYGATHVLAGPKDKFTVQFAVPKDARACREALEADAHIVYAEPDAFIYAAETDADDIAYYSWGAAPLGYPELSAYANAASTGGVMVAVIDSGVMSHSFLDGRIGKVGYDYIDMDEDPSNDDTGHGTHVAGIIADVTQGTRVTIMPIRVMSKEGGLISNFINAMKEARLAGAKIINASLTSDSCNNALEQAILEMTRSGVTVVIAAGNKEKNVADVCPAHMSASGVIVVSAVVYTNGEWIKSAYSNFGATVDISAPGNYIKSCGPSNSFIYKSGTSMSTPHISAACALMKIISPSMSPSGQESKLKEIEAPLSLGVPGYPQLNLLVPSQLMMASDTIVMREGDTLAAYSIAPTASIGAVETVFSDADIAAVGDGALLTGLAPGETTLTVQTANGLTGTASVTVVPASQYTVVTLPADTAEIGNNAFADSDSVYEFALPEGVLTIGDGAFAGCDLLCRLNLPAGVTSIGDNAFAGCPNLIVRCEDDSYALAYCVENSIDILVN